MIRFTLTSLLAIVAAATLASAQTAPPAPPKDAFRAVHLLNLKSDADVSTMLRSLADQNAVVAKLGVPTKYRLYKVSGPQAGAYAYLMESSWASGAVYEKVHRSPEWQALQKAHPEIEALLKGEVYNRYVEVEAKR